MAKETGNAVEEAVGANSRKKYILIGGAALLLVIISVAATLLIVRFMGPAPADAPTVTEAPVDVRKPAIYYPLKPAFVVNFASAGRQRFLQTDLSLLIRESDISAALDLHMPAIRNGLVLLFSAQDFDNLQTAEGKEELRQQALEKVQEVLLKEIGKPGVEQVLFTSFVMQ